MNSPVAIALNPSLRLPELAAAYARKQRLQVKSVLTEESAERIHQCLSFETPWGLVYNTGPDIVELTREQLTGLAPEQTRTMYAEIYQRARSDYQFVYHYYPILTSFQSGLYKDFFLHRVLEFLNTDSTLDFIRALTGLKDIVKADAQATFYKGSNFLHMHNDEERPEGRRCAYVLNFTKDWQPNWGGYLQFFDTSGNVEEALKPIFNALHIFTVPQLHSVGFVPPFARGQRFAITGWFRNK